MRGGEDALLGEFLDFEKTMGFGVTLGVALVFGETLVFGGALDFVGDLGFGEALDFLAALRPVFLRGGDAFLEEAGLFGVLCDALAAVRAGGVVCRRGNDPVVDRVLLRFAKRCAGDCEKCSTSQR